MNDYSTTGCIVWPVRELNVPDAHVTVVYLGEISYTDNGLERAVRALKQVESKTPGTVAITGYEVFGQDSLVDVATLDDTYLLPMFEEIEGALLRNGLRNGSSFPGYRPHVTLGPANSDAPLRLTSDSVFLESPVIWWKELTVTVL
jgi:2'-5' RNA ligase